MNEQKMEHLDHDKEGRIVVHSWFNTIQGEGPFAGEPAIFVRLKGCNLQCPLCDTDYVSGVQYSPQEVLTNITSLERVDSHSFTWSKKQLVVITGGEPFRQNISPLVRLLVESDYRVQIETNGTLYCSGPWDNENVTIVVSPKTPHIHEGIEKFAKAYKYVACASDIDPVDGLPNDVLGRDACWLHIARPPTNFKGPVYLQPADVKDPVWNKVHRDAVVESCLRYGHILGLQLHKILGME